MVTPLVRIGWLLLAGWFGAVIWMCLRLSDEGLSISPSSVTSNMIERYGMFYGWMPWMLSMGFLALFLSMGAGDLLIRWVRTGKARDH